MEKDIVEILKEDHKEVNRLFDEYESAPDAKKPQIVSQICNELDTHGQIEKQIFYPAMEDIGEDEEEMVENSLETHRKIDDAVNDLRTMSRDDSSASEYDDKVKDLARMVRDHIEEEEKNMFPDARKNIEDDDLDAITTEAKAMKETLEDTFQS